MSAERDELGRAIRTATSRDQAAAAVAPLRRAELVDLARELGIHHRAAETAAGLRHMIVHYGCGRRLDSAAISRPA